MLCIFYLLQLQLVLTVSSVFFFLLLVASTHSSNPSSLVLSLPLFCRREIIIKQVHQQNLLLMHRSSTSKRADRRTRWGELHFEGLLEDDDDVRAVVEKATHALRGKAVSNLLIQSKLIDNF
jgi:hypothetical protein